MSCPTCEKGLSPGLAACPGCGAPNPRHDPIGSTVSDDGPTFRLPGTAGSQPAGGVVADRPLGFVIVYAESSAPPASGPATSLGRAWPLRVGELFFAGKDLKEQDVFPRADGVMVRPTARHLFPFSQDYAHISRRHVTIEFETNGQIRVADTSANGTWLVKGGVHLRRGREESRIHTIGGDESLVLGVDLGASTDARARDQANRYTLQLVRALRGGGPGGAS